MIPKQIHYCWFGHSSLPKLAVKCIESWKRYCPDYEIKEWNEDNFDVNIIPYTKEAYEAKKYAFVSDFARFWILYNYGGVYFDTDVEVIKSLDNILSIGSFMGCEENGSCAPGLGIACNPGLGIYKEFIDGYKKRHFLKKDGSFDLTTIVEYTTNILKKHGLENTSNIQNIEGINIFPKEYFNPMDMDTGKIIISNKTVSIHHYAGSWLDEKGKRRGKVYKLLKRFLGIRIANFVRKTFGKRK